MKLEEVKSGLREAKDKTLDFVMAHPVGIAKAGLLIFSGCTVYRTGFKRGFTAGECRGRDRVCDGIVASSNGLRMTNGATKETYIFTATKAE